MSGRKRPLDEDRFLGSHFSSGGRLGVDGTESVRGAGPEALKHVVLRILQDGETVVKYVMPWCPCFCMTPCSRRWLHDTLQQKVVMTSAVGRDPAGR